MSVPVLLALAESGWESRLVARLAGGGPLTVAKRCVDLPDLLATAAAGVGRAALVSSTARHFDGQALARLAAAGVAVVAVVPAGDEAEERRIRQLGIRHVVAEGAAPEAATAAVMAALADPHHAGSARDYASGPVAHRAPVSQGADPSDDPAAEGGVDTVDEPAAVIAVWGPAGAPGRSTVALNLAAELAQLRGSALLVDADTHAASQAQLLGLLDEAAGLAAACRMAGAGRLDVAAMGDVAVAVGGGLRVLTGIARADRWVEIRPSALTTVLELSRRTAGAVVVDIGAGLEQDEELVYDTAAPRRNGAALAVLDAADTVLAVGSADPVGLQRLVRGVAELRDAVPAARPRPVVNRLRRGPVPGDAAAEIAAALDRFGGLADPSFLPMDVAACDAALAGGRTLVEAAPSSTLRRSIRELAADLAGAGAPGRSGRRWGRGRRRA